MKNLLLIIYAIFFSINIQAQSIDILATNKPLDIGFTKITHYKFNKITQEFEVKGERRKSELNVIYIGIPKSVKNSDIDNFIKRSLYNPKMSDVENEIIYYSLPLTACNRRNIVYEGNKYILDKFSERDVKILRLFNYKNTQNSLELNTSDYFSGTAELETGEKCQIYHNIGYLKEQDRYWMQIVVGDFLVQYVF